jgi:phage protein D
MGLGISIRVNGAPDEMAATMVEVSERVGQPTNYRLQYSLDSAEGDFPLLKEAKFGSGSEVSILAPASSETHCLVKGPVYGQQITFVQGGSGSLLNVLGADSLIKMDREDKAVAWSNLTDSAAVTAIISQAGFVPDVDTTQAGHFELKHTLIQRETDLAFVQRLARRNGNFFWLSCDTLGVETAHFKRPVLSGQAACDLVINLSDPRSNLTSLEINWDAERPTSAAATELDLNSKSDISGAVQRSPLTALGGSSLADVATGQRVVHVRAPVDDSGDLQARGEGALIDAAFFLRASGATTLSALGSVLRSHTLVNLRGVGSRHSGLWYCSAVRHAIDASAHRMEFELIRNGWAN